MADNVYAGACAAAAGFGVAIAPEEPAAVAERGGFGKGELEAVAAVFDYLGQRHEEHAVETPLRLSGLPRTAPKTFDSFDFSRTRGRDAAALRALPELTNLYPRKNVAFIGPGGIGKTHLAQAYGRECCLRGHKTSYIKATELRDRLRTAADSGDPSMAVSALVRPSCLIVDEVGSCTFDRERTDLFFDVVDRRYEKEGPDTLILASNTQANNWDQFFAGDETLLCALERIFDRASVFVMRGPSFRGAGLDTFSVEAKPAVVRDKR